MVAKQLPELALGSGPGCAARMADDAFSAWAVADRAWHRPALQNLDDFDIIRAYGRTVPPDALPDTVIINRAGMIAATIIGGATCDNLMTLVSKVGTTR
jgi:hypothetical protein